MSIMQQAARCRANQEAYKILNAFVTPIKDTSWKVQEAAARLESGKPYHNASNTIASHTNSPAEKPKSDIDGQLIAIKDNICTTEEPTSCASAILNGFISPYAATVVEKIQRAGAIVAGKTNMDEFGMGYVYNNYCRVLLTEGTIQVPFGQLDSWTCQEPFRHPWTTHLRGR